MARNYYPPPRLKPSKSQDVPKPAEDEPRQAQEGPRPAQDGARQAQDEAQQATQQDINSDDEEIGPAKPGSEDDPVVNPGLEFWKKKLIVTSA